jgi:hypothetical protein
MLAACRRVRSAMTFLPLSLRCPRTVAGNPAGPPGPKTSSGGAMRVDTAVCALVLEWIVSIGLDPNLFWHPFTPKDQRCLFGDPLCFASP